MLIIDRYDMRTIRIRLFAIFRWAARMESYSSHSIVTSICIFTEAFNIAAYIMHDGKARDNPVEKLIFQSSSRFKSGNMTKSVWVFFSHAFLQCIARYFLLFRWHELQPDNYDTVPKVREVANFNGGVREVRSRSFNVRSFTGMRVMRGQSRELR